MAKHKPARPSKGGNAKSRGATNRKQKSRGATISPDDIPRRLFDHPASPIIADPPYQEVAPPFDAEALAAAIIVKLKGDVLTDVTRMALRLHDSADRLSVVTADAGFLIQRYLIDSIKAGEGVPGTLQETAELISGPEAEELKTAQGQVRTLLELLRPFADAYAVAAPKRSDKCRRVRITDDFSNRVLAGLDFQCFEIAAAAFSKGIPGWVPPSGTLQNVAQRISNRIHNAGCWAPDFLAEVVESELSKELTAGLGKVQEIEARASELGAETEKQQQVAATRIAELERRCNAYEQALQPFARAWKEHASGLNHHSHTAGGHFRSAAQTFVAHGGKLAAEGELSDAELAQEPQEMLSLAAFREAAEEAAKLGYDRRERLLLWLINQAKKANNLNSKLVEIYRNVFGNIARECLRQGRTSKPEDDRATADKIVEATLSIWNLAGPLEFDGAAIERELRELKADRIEIVEVVMRQGFSPTDGVPLVRWIGDELQTLAALRKQIDEHSAWALKIGGDIAELSIAAKPLGFEVAGTVSVLEFATKGLGELAKFRQAFEGHGLNATDPKATVARLNELAEYGHRHFNNYQAANSQRTELLAAAVELLKIVKAAAMPLEDKTSEGLRNLAAVVTKLQRTKQDGSPFKRGERVEFIPEHKRGRITDVFLDSRWAPELGHWYVRLEIEGTAAPDDPNKVKQNLQLRADECRLLLS